MSYDHYVSDHYHHGDLLNAIEAALAAIGKTTANVTITDLAPVDEFHIGGRFATDNLIEQLHFSNGDHVLDVGCGLGGAARYVATKCKTRVTGIDLAAEYIETGKALCRWLNLEASVSLEQGSALSMPFQDYSFDGGYMLHVGMNIDNKASLFAEINRVLKPGSYLGVYDVMRQKEGGVIYPVPWATDRSTCKLSSPAQYLQALSSAGFKIISQHNRRAFALEFFKKIAAKTKGDEALPALGLHILMQESTAPKIKNMVENILNGLIAPVEIIAQKT